MRAPAEEASTLRQGATRPRLILCWPSDVGRSAWPAGEILCKTGVSDAGRLARSRGIPWSETTHEGRWRTGVRSRCLRPRRQCADTRRRRRWSSHRCSGVDRRRDVLRIRHAACSPGMSPMSMMGGGMLGGGPSKNSFGMTQSASTGRWVDVTLYTSRNPTLGEATQAVPGGTQLAPTLKLVAPKVEKGPPPTPGDEWSSSSSTSGRRARCICTGVAATRCAPDSRAYLTWPLPGRTNTASSLLRDVRRSVEPTLPLAARCGRTKSTRG